MAGPFFVRNDCRHKNNPASKCISHKTATDKSREVEILWVGLLPKEPLLYAIFLS